MRLGAAYSREQDERGAPSGAGSGRRRPHPCTSPGRAGGSCLAEGASFRPLHFPRSIVSFSCEIWEAWQLSWGQERGPVLLAQQGPSCSQFCYRRESFRPGAGPSRLLYSFSGAVDSVESFSWLHLTQAFHTLCKHPQALITPHLSWILFSLRSPPSFF